MGKLCLWSLLSYLAPLALAAKVAEPADGHLMLGAWLDTSVTSKDTPALFNSRIGFNAASFQFAQTIPLAGWNSTTGGGGTMNLTFIENSATDAALFLTVYPNQGLGNVTNDDFTALGQQILYYQSPPFNRAVFLRYAPEMNGNWMAYGLLPAQFVLHWRNMHAAISAIAPDTTFVWAPNSGIGYPYSKSFADLPATATEADRDALDTNHNGQLDGGDNSYMPYYPGDDYVDWAGISVYYKGNYYPFIYNYAPDYNYLTREMTGFVSGDDTAWTPFYSTFCLRKPCMLAECGAAYHVNTTAGPGIGQVTLQQDWLDLFWQAPSVNTRYPRVKMMQMFEQMKVEDSDDLRDFRLTNNSQVRSAFVSAVSPFVENGTIITANVVPVVAAPTRYITVTSSGSLSVAPLVGVSASGDFVSTSASSIPTMSSASTPTAAPTSAPVNQQNAMVGAASLISVDVALCRTLAVSILLYALMSTL